MCDVGDPGFQQAALEHKARACACLECTTYREGDATGFKELERAASAFSENLPSFSSGEVRSVDPLTGGEKGVKVERYELLPVLPLREVARVYGYGATKYADRNWEKGYSWSKSFGALLRHVYAFWFGETNDPESGLPHMAHAVFHCLALMEWGRTKPEMDDRVKG